MFKITVATLLFWLTIVGGSFWWNLADEKKESRQLAFETARTMFQQIVLTRAWNAGHGGVYAPVSSTMKPNPYLTDPLRDVVTTQGVQLTKINPAYMTRQIAEIAANKNGIQFHITSLRPIRPGNKATEWEKDWLKSFENGMTEQGGFTEVGATTVFRYMAPLLTEKSCLKCHAKHGYTLGDVRGGISITIPTLVKENNIGLIVGYGITCFVGVIFTLLGGLLLHRKESMLMQSNNSLQAGIDEQKKLVLELKEAYNEIKTLSGILPICSYCKEIRDDKGYWNQLEKYIGEHSTAQFSHSICPKCMKEKFPNIDMEES